VGSREKPATTEDVKDVEDREFDLLRKRTGGCSPTLPSRSVTFTRSNRGGEICGENPFDGESVRGGEQ
jgi:hypothetical protein